MRTSRGGLPAVALVLGVAAGLVAPAPAPAQVPAVQPLPTITVEGEDTVHRAPDMAVIRLGVTAGAKTAGDAVAQLAPRLDAVLKRLRAEGVQDRDMQSSGLSLSPRYDQPARGTGEAPKIVGFEASSTVTVRVRKLDALGGVLDAVVRDGADRFSGLSFGLADPGPAQDAARRAAVADAMHRAALYAAAAGVKLGDLRSLSDAGGSGGPLPMQRAAPMAFKAEAVPVAQGEIDVTAQVRMVFSIAR